MTARRRELLVLFACALVLAAYTVTVQVRALGPEYITTGNQFTRHQSILDGTNGMHWQYRILSELIVEGVIRGLRALGSPYAIAGGFIGMRYVQNVALFLLAGLFYRRNGVRLPTVVLGLTLLAWAMTHCLYDSDLSLSTYMGLVFYVCAALLIQAKRYAWIIPLTFIAALNRETSGLMPFMLAVEGIRLRGPDRGLDRRILAYAAAALALYAAAFIGLRAYYGLNPLPAPYGHYQGVDMFFYNVGRIVTWLQLAATVGPLAVLGVIGLRACPPQLRRTFLMVVPAWFAIHFIGSVLVETRLILVPVVIGLLPATLCGLAASTPEPLEAARPVGA